MPLRDQPRGGYRFLPGIDPYSGGVVSTAGHEIVHVTYQRPVPYRQGFDRIEQHLTQEGRPRAALCGIELRSPRPFTFEGFASFNAGYAQILEDWGLFVDGVNPVARTNVAPEPNPPSEPVLYGFSYTRPCDVRREPTFVVAGGGELPEGELSPSAIIWPGETSTEALAHKAAFVLDLMEARLHQLGMDWPAVNVVDIYTIHPVHHLLRDILLDRIGPAALHGVHWYYSRPPVVGIEFEMDLRGVATEIRVE